MIVCSAGYERRSIEEFVAMLGANRVTALVDVRELPLSRKKGFSKRRIQERLAKENIEYYHLRALGSPRDMRRELGETRDYREFFARYRSYVTQQLEVLDTLARLASNQITCLMCYEKEPLRCHRSVIFDEIVARNDAFEVHHL